jgi:hypothetical protein
VSVSSQVSGKNEVQLGSLREPRRAHTASWLKSDRLFAAVVIFLIAITVARLVPTYTIFTGTYDEPVHIASGMEWLDQGTYGRYRLDNPPLARVAVATGLFLKGLRSHGKEDAVEEGNQILYSDGNYSRNLTLARLGTLPFLILACVTILLWMRRWFTAISGIWALLLFLSLPPVLGHSALATLDIACAATIVTVLYQFMRWLENPTWPRSIGLGAALGLAILTKFSSFTFLGVCGPVAIACYFLSGRDRLTSHRQPRLRVGRLAITVCLAFVLVWAGYRFSLKSLSADQRYQKTSSESPKVAAALSRISEVRLPLVEMGHGLFTLFVNNRKGYDSFLLGQYRRTGWWYFFPVVLGVKTPIGLLVLASAGILVMLMRFQRSPWQHRLTALLPFAVLAVCMTSGINLGVRHILLIYPLLSMAAGYAVSVALQGRRLIISLVSLLLVASVVVEGWMAHPDYLAYFDQLAGAHPENVLSDSDLDWGQDLGRLSSRLKSLGIRQVAIAYFGSAPLEKADLPQYRILSPDEKATGYVAASMRFVTLEYAKNGAYGWLKQHRPLEKIGKSIYLYRIEE